MSDTEKVITIHVPVARGVEHEEQGKIVRVVGNSIAYVNLPSGHSFAFSADDIERYSGQTLNSIGVREGAAVRVMPDPSDAHISVRLKR
jgi:hypothetical protein